MGDVDSVCSDNWVFCDHNTYAALSEEESKRIFDEGWGPMRFRNPYIFDSFYDAYYDFARDFDFYKDS